MKENKDFRSEVKRYKELVTTEEQHIQEINDILADDGYLHSDMELSNIIQLIEPQLSLIQSVNRDQEAIIAELKNEELKPFVNELLDNRLDHEEVADKVSILITKHVFPRDQNKVHSKQLRDPYCFLHTILQLHHIL